MGCGSYEDIYADGAAIGNLRYAKALYELARSLERDLAAERAHADQLAAALKMGMYGGAPRDAGYDWIVHGKRVLAEHDKRRAADDGRT